MSSYISDCAKYCASRLRGNLNENAKLKISINAAARAAVDDAAAETGRIIDRLQITAPRARKALASRPSHAAWEAVRDAELVVKGQMPRCRAPGPYINTLRGIAGLVARHAGS